MLRTCARLMALLLSCTAGAAPASPQLAPPDPGIDALMRDYDG